jgi:hypothetical protein
MPDYLKAMIKAKTLRQWGKFPHIMFVAGVENARIHFCDETGLCHHKYVDRIPNKEQYAIFRDVYNSINAMQNELGNN